MRSRVKLAIAAGAAASALVAAFVLGTAGTATAAETPTEAGYATAVFNQLNSERASNGLPPLSWNDTLANCSAYNHDVLMAADNTMSHQLPGEAALGDRITACGYQWTTVGENIGWTTDMSQAGALSIETSMYNEVPPNDGHRQNILSSTFTEVGIAVVLDSTNHKLWLTEDFGRPVNSQPSPTKTATPTTSPTTPTATPTSSAPATGTPSSAEAKDAQAVFTLLNTERTNKGLPALKWNATLANCSAYAHSQLMAASNTMSHQLPGEAAVGDRITACGYHWSSVGENIGWTSTMTAAGAKAVEKSMYTEKPPNDEHRQNILSTSFTDVGIGIVLDNVNHKLWITEDFGHPLG